MSAALWPGLLLAVAAWCIAGRRVYVLCWLAPADAGQLGAALARRLSQGQRGKASALCDALEGCWPACCAAEILRGTASADELQAAYGVRAQQGLDALGGLGRMAFPLALGAAIVVMGQASGTAAPAQVEAALSVALQSLTLGLMSTVFCRASAAAVRRLGQARMREVATVCGRVSEALAQSRRVAAPRP